MQRLIENEESVLEAVAIDVAQADGGDSDEEGTGEEAVNLFVPRAEDPDTVPDEIEDVVGLYDTNFTQAPLGW